MHDTGELDTPQYVAHGVTRIIERVVDPWADRQVSDTLVIERLDGTKITIAPGPYLGRPREMFWDRLVQPHFEQLVNATVEKIALAGPRDAMLLAMPLSAASRDLRSGARDILARMAEVDRLLRGPDADLRLVDIEEQLADLYIERRLRVGFEIIEAMPKPVKPRWPLYLAVAGIGVVAIAVVIGLTLVF